MNRTLQLGGFLLAAIIIIGAIILTAMDKTIPEAMWTFGGLALGTGAGATIPASHTGE